MISLSEQVRQLEQKCGRLVQTNKQLQRTIQELELEEAQRRPIQCAECGQFVSKEKVHWDEECGDYGDVLSAVPYCERCR